MNDWPFRFLFPVFLIVIFAAQRAFCAEAILLDISLPITGKSSQAIARTLERAVQEIRLAESQDEVETAEDIVANGEFQVTSTLILQFKIAPDQETFGRGSSFGACYELASLLTSEKFASIRTVAYFPQSVKGHALLVALACHERIMADGAEIGEATIDETELSKTEREAYLEIARHRATLPLAVVEKIFDPSVELLQLETEKGLRLVTPAGVEQLRQTETFAAEPEPLIPAGLPGFFSADTARRINLVQLIANDRVALARGLGFRPDDIKNAPIPGELGHAVRINLEGLITPDNTGAVIRSINAALGTEATETAQPADFLCLYIDSPGGDVESSLNLASYILENVDAARIRTVAYVPFQARSDAALVALVCDEIVLGPGATLGGDGAVEFSAQQLDDARQMLQDFLSKAALRSWSLPVGFIDRDIEVFERTRLGRPPLIDYFCDEEWMEQPDAELWKKGKIVKAKGKTLEIVGGETDNQFFVDRIAADFAEFKFLYGIENDPMLVEPSWADRAVRFLASPGMGSIVLLIVFLAAMFESNTPGLGIGAFVAVLGLVFFFWINFLGGTAGWLEVMLFLVGVLCIGLELFVLPGMGIFGIGGAVAIIVSLVLASQTFIIPQNSYQLGQFRNSILVLAVSGMGVFILGGVISKAIHNANRPKDTETIKELEKLASYDHLLGELGTALTPLVPAGKALFGGEPIDVVSDGGLIEKDAHIEVIDVVGYRVVVRAVGSLTES